MKRYILAFALSMFTLTALTATASAQWHGGGDRDRGFDGGGFRGGYASAPVPFVRGPAYGVNVGVQGGYYGGYSQPVMQQPVYSQPAYGYQTTYAAPPVAYRPAPPVYAAPAYAQQGWGGFFGGWRNGFGHEGWHHHGGW